MTHDEVKAATTTEALFGRLRVARESLDAGLITKTEYDTRLVAIEYEAAETYDVDVVRAVGHELVKLYGKDWRL